MKSQNMRMSKVQRRKKLYLPKKIQQKRPSSYLSHQSSEMSSESFYDSCDDRVCTNCVETDFYLSQFCNELLYSPSSAIYHLEKLIKNPEFPKGDLYLSEWEYNNLSTSVPVTTSTCIDCNPFDERISSTQISESFLSSEFDLSANSVSTATPSCNYDKQRREMERELIKNIYDLVCDQHVSNSPHESATSRRSSRVTKLHVSEMAIARMENVQKINYSSQIDRIKHKLLESYRAFARLDQYIHSHKERHLSATDIKIPPYHQKIKNLENSLHIHHS